MTSQRGDLDPWLRFFLHGVRQQARDAEERTVRLVEEQQQLREQLLDEGRAKSVLKLADQLFATPIITTGRAVELLDVTRPTAQRAIDTLVERGDLIEITGSERNRVYEARAIFDAVSACRPRSSCPASADAATVTGP